MSLGLTWGTSDWWKDFDKFHSFKKEIGNLILKGPKILHQQYRLLRSFQFSTRHHGKRIIFYIKSFIKRTLKVSYVKKDTSYFIHRRPLIISQAITTISVSKLRLFLFPRNSYLNEQFPIRRQLHWIILSCSLINIFLLSYKLHWNFAIIITTLSYVYIRRHYSPLFLLLQLYALLPFLFIFI